MPCATDIVGVHCHAVSVPPPELPPDDVLTGLLLAGDESAFAQVVDAWSPGMVRLARVYVSTEDSAAEVVQEAWLAVVRGIGTFAGRSSLRTWVYRIVANLARRRGGREARTVPASSLRGVGDGGGPTVDPARFAAPGHPLAGHWERPPTPWPTPEQALLAAEVRSEVTAALAGLPARQRVVITLRDVHGYDAAEVCSILEISAANQRVLLHRARATVRLRLERYFDHAAVRTGEEVP
ncbi:RNA polymerase sigma-70 factor, ECF subfamily [Jiangella alkaliphila]|uniref:RNA polymerase sigma-70 factor, ECF subfamily n=1 Tax=Jiangella alkaliphila TaxID=419479 RepID=A0A1H2G0I6_9ACTN|nr:RNA polymerase sigma-70 factor, ECF subfamily [Jiangella alkaliphila]